MEPTRILRLIDGWTWMRKSAWMREMIDARTAASRSARNVTPSFKAPFDVQSFNRRDDQGRRLTTRALMILEASPSFPGPASDGPARRWPLRDRVTSTTSTAGHQPQQPTEAPARPRCARHHCQQREAHAARGVDALFRQRRRGRPVAVRVAASESLSDMLKGKQGRFRQNLLGKA